jgi:hypothetical protein
MSHYAKVKDGIVVSVIVAEADFFTNGHFVDTSPGTWIQTSYNTRGGVHYGQDGQPDGGTALRGNYAGLGYIYDSQRDVFISPKPYNSWILNETTYLWSAPIEKPTDDKKYMWDENTINWVEVTGV